MSADQQLNTDDDDDNKLVRPKVEFQTFLRDAGATKEVFTVKEVMFYLGQYIIQKRLYDRKQQHIVHCSQDALGRVLGLDSFSVKEPQALFAMIAKNLVAVKNQESPPSSSEPHSDTQTDRVTEVRLMIIQPGSGRSEVTVAASDSDSDIFSVEFEVESMDSDDYNEDDASLSADDQVYEVAIVEAEDNDSFDEDTEITEDDYWRCAKCDKLNPLLPRNCLHCWTLCQDWLSAAKETPGSDVEENEGVDVLDGQRVKTPLLPQRHSDSSLSAPPSSSMDSQELLSSPPTPHPAIPDLDRSMSAEWRLPDSCLDPCLICQSRPKDGCIVHGLTGHLMSCYVCARKLKKRNKLCPACRLPIQSVILTYLS
ncbi:E3 ubiquitin-protein ligase Mdm2-like [Lycodopsis pacificus]